MRSLRRSLATHDMTQPINPEAIMQRLRQLLADLEAPGWQVHIRVVCHHPTGRVTFEVGEKDSNADP